MGHISAPEQDTFLAFLPLAHILEYVVELAFGYVNSRSATAASERTARTAASVRNCQGDLKTFRPTIMTGAHQIWETTRKGSINSVNKSGAVKKSLF